MSANDQLNLQDMENQNEVCRKRPVWQLIATWASIGIAFVAVTTSVISNCNTRKEYIQTTRPFVWSLDYSVYNDSLNSLVLIPEKVMFLVSNNPAKINKLIFDISLNRNSLFKHTQNEFVRFPEERSEWTYTVPSESIESINRNAEGQLNKLVRTIEIEYSSIYGGTIYHYLKRGVFEPTERKWITFHEETD